MSLDTLDISANELHLTLNSFDKEMEKREVTFVSSANYICMMSKSKMALDRIKRNAMKYLEK
ncbi:MAG: hypothetical protein JJE21_02840 [Spirochaetaceae bacterium]|nr:hypothetical protein [Spirochaetaceae bacterium]